MPAIIFILLIIILIFIVTSFFYFIGMIWGFIFLTPYVPTSQKIVRQMAKLAKIKKGEKVFELGCGDGRLLFEAEKYGAKAVGIEISPPIYFFALIKKWLTKSPAKIYLGNMFKLKNIKEADVVLIFTSPPNMKNFGQKIFPKLKKGTRIISHAFCMPGVKPIKIINPGQRLKTVVIYEKKDNFPLR